MTDERTSKELVQRLRDIAHGMNAAMNQATLREAADEIERLGWELVDAVSQLAVKHDVDNMAMHRLAMLQSCAERRARLTGEIERLQRRLEMFDDKGDLLPEHCDGIACRDETIKLLDERIEKLRAGNEPPVLQVTPAIAEDIRGVCLSCGQRAVVQPAQPPATALLREWLCASDNFDMDAWTRKVRDLVEDGTAPPPEPSRITDAQCDEIIGALETYEWTGFTRDDIRLIAGTIETYRGGAV